VLSFDNCQPIPGIALLNLSASRKSARKPNWPKSRQKFPQVPPLTADTNSGNAAYSGRDQSIRLN
jgi:hypothetical protein